MAAGQARQQRNGLSHATVAGSNPSALGDDDGRQLGQESDGAVELLTRRSGLAEALECAA